MHVCACARFYFSCMLHETRAQGCIFVVVSNTLLNFITSIIQILCMQLHLVCRLFHLVSFVFIVIRTNKIAYQNWAILNMWDDESWVFVCFDYIILCDSNSSNQLHLLIWCVHVSNGKSFIQLFDRIYTWILDRKRERAKCSACVAIQVRINITLTKWIV